MGYAPYPAINEVGIVTALHQGFVRQIQGPRAFIALAAPHQKRFGRWFHEQAKWREVGRAAGQTSVAMRLPPHRSTGAGKLKARTYELPFWVRDLAMADRDFAQMQESGLDEEIFTSHAEGMLDDLNSFFASGMTKDKGDGLTADIKGITNHGLAGAGDALTEGGDWSDPVDMNADLSKANDALATRRQGMGPKALVMNEGDQGVFNQFLASTSVRIGQNMPGFISRVLYESDAAIVPKGTAWLIQERPGNFEVVSPVDEAGMSFGLGNVAAGIVQGDDFIPASQIPGTRQQEENVMMKSMKVRFLNIIGMRILRDSDNIGGVDHTWSQKITFERS